MREFYANYVRAGFPTSARFGLPDIYQEGNTFLDFVYQYTFGEKGKWALRFEAENLGDNDYRWTQGDYSSSGEYQIGRTFQIGLSYSFF